VTDGQPRRPLRADARANREALLESARVLYVERGADVPLEDIARHAGVGRATVYRHFPQRDDLLFALLHRLVGELEELAAAVPEGPDGFMKLFRAAVRHQVDHLPLVQLLAVRGRLPFEIDQLRDRLQALYRRPLATAQEAGVVRADLTPQDIRVLFSMLSAVVRPTTPDADRRRALRMATVVLAP
jgi:AcrR family transcriptional regulator